jgi:hypothetical protein
MAVQRHRAASRSAKPASNAQHSLEGGDPIEMGMSPRMLAQTPSFNASLGQDSGGGAIGVGMHPPQAVVTVE